MEGNQNLAGNYLEKDKLQQLHIMLICRNGNLFGNFDDKLFNEDDKKEYERIRGAELR